MTETCYNAGDTTWVLLSSLLVLGMMPALAFFESGMLRSKNTLSLLMQVFSGIITLSVLWLFIGYSLVFSDTAGGVIGNLNAFLMLGVDYFNCSVHAPTIPTACFALFEMMFAAITPLLITGSFAERMKWHHAFWFIVLWEIIIYYPVAHWIWGLGFMSSWPVLDFAGGIVIHTTAGMGSLVVALVLGPRNHFEKYHGEFPASNVPLAATGAALLWMGWFGFNGGSALQAGPAAVSAIISTQIGGACGGFTWLVLTWRSGKPSLIGVLNGCLAGLAGITPASGYINTQWSILLGFIFGISSFYGVHLAKHKLGIDDALDVTMIHGLTGVLGSIAVGLFANSEHSGIPNANGAVYGNPNQLGYQFAGIAIAAAWAGIWTYIILKVLEKIFGPLRVSSRDETLGLDWTEIGEIAYHKLHVLSSHKPATINDPNHHAQAHGAAEYSPLDDLPHDDHYRVVTPNHHVVERSSPGPISDHGMTRVPLHAPHEM